ncbi:MAG: hypothetical protein HY270_24525 [Deltaproteobacteria bacterium]|nr:hypothetical protein [Deltaproteobacteria bacterium]
MRSKWLWSLVGILSLLAASKSVRADYDPDLYDYDVLIDSDNNTATGCTVALHDLNFNGSVSGVEYIVTAHVDRFSTSATVDSVTIRQCMSGSTFSGPSEVDPGSWAVGLQTGIPVPSPYNFADVVEFYVPLASIANSGMLHLYFHATQSTLKFNDVLLTTNGQDTGSPILFRVANHAAPALSPLALAVAALLLTGFARWGLRRRSRLVTAAIVLAFSISLAFTVWAVTIALDGSVSDWTGVPAAGTDAVNDSSIGDPAEDIAAAFVTADAQNLYFRFDQVNLAPVVCGDGIVESGEYCETTADCEPACDVAGGASCGTSVAGGSNPTSCACVACMCVGDCNHW